MRFSQLAWVATGLTIFLAIIDKDPSIFVATLLIILAIQNIKV